MCNDGLIKCESSSKSYLLSEVSQTQLPFLGSKGTSYTSLLVLPSPELKLESRVSRHVYDLVGETSQECVDIEAKRPGKRNPRFCLLSVFRQDWWYLQSPQGGWFEAFPRRSKSLLGDLDLSPGLIPMGLSPMVCKEGLRALLHDILEHVCWTYNVAKHGEERVVSFHSVTGCRLALLQDFGGGIRGEGN